MTISNKIELRIKALEARLAEHEGGNIAAWEQVSKDVTQLRHDVQEILTLLRGRTPSSAD
ncbi:hypothetical protein GCM10010174_43300 [Kutzneria viridogrisea]|uniref:Spo0E like sporulation regulatory protein n=1 Tax=Kutzneria viridogrisea TaxID=47990 RepID=A0ABR6BP28_9PSEU|nr:hypothetical protein [Kutzneria viridogrisea]